MSSVSTTIYVERLNPETQEYDELEIEVTGTATPFVRGRYSGPPEKCYPDEGGEIEDLAATHKGKPFELTSAEEDKAIEALQEVASDVDEGPDPDDYDDDFEPDYDRDYGD